MAWEIIRDKTFEGFSIKKDHKISWKISGSEKGFFVCISKVGFTMQEDFLQQTIPDELKKIITKNQKSVEFKIPVDDTYHILAAYYKKEDVRDARSVPITFPITPARIIVGWFDAENNLHLSRKSEQCIKAQIFWEEKMSTEGFFARKHFCTVTIQKSAHAEYPEDAFYYKIENSGEMPFDIRTIGRLTFKVKDKNPSVSIGVYEEYKDYFEVRKVSLN